MKKFTTLTWSGIGLLVIVALGVLGDQVGGIAIRNNVTRVGQFELSFSQPIIRGAPILIHWNYDTTASERALILWRDSVHEQILAESQIAAKRAVVVLPCAVSNAVGSLIIRDAATRRILASSAVDLLAPGPECVGHKPSLRSAGGNSE